MSVRPPARHVAAGMSVCVCARRAGRREGGRRGGRDAGAGRGGASRVCRCGARVPAARSGGATLSVCARDDERVPPVRVGFPVSVPVSPGGAVPRPPRARGEQRRGESPNSPREELSSAPMCLHSPSAQGFVRIFPFPAGRRSPLISLPRPLFQRCVLQSFPSCSTAISRCIAGPREGIRKRLRSSSTPSDTSRLHRPRSRNDFPGISSEAEVNYIAFRCNKLSSEG